MKTFIAELMPSWPIYISLLPAAAQRVISEVSDADRLRLVPLYPEENA